jgi:hypothetical protein
LHCFHTRELRVEDRVRRALEDRLDSTVVARDEGTVVLEVIVG